MSGMKVPHETIVPENGFLMWCKLGRRTVHEQAIQCDFLSIEASNQELYGPLVHAFSVLRSQVCMSPQLVSLLYNVRILSHKSSRFT